MSPIDALIQYYTMVPHLHGRSVALRTFMTFSVAFFAFTLLHLCTNRREFIPETRIRYTGNVISDNYNYHIRSYKEGIRLGYYTKDPSKYNNASVCEPYISS